MRRAAGVLLCISGGIVLSFTVGRYALGMARADAARRAWNDEEARHALAASNAAVSTHGRTGPVGAGAPVARLLIPKLALDEIVVEGVNGDELNAGPGHLPGSAFPGERGNSIISAHRDRHFSRFADLAVGDTIRTETGGAAQTWVVVAARVIDRAAPALFKTREPTLTLTTCWPIRYLGPAPERLIVTARLAGQKAG